MVIAFVTLGALQLASAVIVMHPWLGAVIIGAALVLAAGWSRRGTEGAPGQ